MRCECHEMVVAWRMLVSFGKVLHITSILNYYICGNTGGATNVHGDHLISIGEAGVYPGRVRVSELSRKESFYPRWF